MKRVAVSNLGLMGHLWNNDQHQLCCSSCGWAGFTLDVKGRLRCEACRKSGLAWQSEPSPKSRSYLAGRYGS